MKIYTNQEKLEIRKQSAKSLKISVAEIADNLYGLTLYVSKKGKQYLKCYEHPALVFDLKENLVYAGNSLNAMSSYDFIAEYEGISKLDARNKLDDYERSRDPRQIQMYHYDEINNDIFTYTGLQLPQRSQGSQDNDIRRILEELHISQAVIDKLIKESLVYEDEGGKVVFVGYDEENKACFGLKQNDIEHLECESCLGSNENYCFSLIDSNNKETVIVINPFDAISLYSMNEKYNLLCCSQENIERVIQKLEKTEWFSKQQHIYTVCKDIETTKLEFFDLQTLVEEYQNKENLEIDFEIDENTAIHDVLNQLSMDNMDKEESVSIG